MKKTITSFKVKVSLYHHNQTIFEESEMIDSFHTKEEAVNKIHIDLKFEFVQHLKEIEFLQQKVLFIVSNHLPFFEGTKLSCREKTYIVNSFEYRSIKEEGTIIFNVKLSNI